MTNQQIAFQFLGWFFLLFLSNRTLSRTELSRLKDQVIVQIDALDEWLKLEVLENDSSNSAIFIEKMYISKIARIDMLLQQFNKLYKFEVLNPRVLLPLWDLDIELICEKKELSHLKDIQQDIIATIEQEYHDGLFTENFFRKLYQCYRPEIYGVISGLVAVSLFVHLVIITVS